MRMEEIFKKYKNEINKGVRIFTLDLEKFGFGSLIHKFKKWTFSSVSR